MKVMFDYLKEVVLEEVVFRVWLFGLFGLVGGFWALLIPSMLLYGLAHFILFRWPMVVASALLGLVLGLIIIYVACPLDLLLCVILHFVVGIMAWKLKLTDKWKRQTVDNELLRIVK